MYKKRVDPDVPYSWKVALAWPYEPKKNYSLILKPIDPEEEYDVKIRIIGGITGNFRDEKSPSAKEVKSSLEKVTPSPLTATNPQEAMTPKVN